MTGKELLSRIIKSINIHLGFNNQDVIDAIDIDANLQDSINRLIVLNPPPNIIDLLQKISTLISIGEQFEMDNGVNSFLSEVYILNGTVHKIDFSLPQLEKKNRSFAHSNGDFSFFSNKILFDNGHLINFQEAKFSSLWTIIQEFWVRCYENEPAAGESVLITDFLTSIENGVVSLGFVINKQPIVFIPERHYSFIYLDYLNNSNSITLSTNLTYNTNQLNNTLILNSTKNYEQYFDIYDVINELNQCSDILNRFLKLYHTLEYLVYRVYLVEMLGRIGTNKVFVREFITASENMAKNEKGSFVKNFQKIFFVNRVQIFADLAPHSGAIVITELDSKNIVKDFAHNQLDKIALSIYGIRCGIVHNKEGEYHLTIANAEDFEQLIPLIRQLITTFENLVVHKLKENDATIHYPNRELNLF